jgi:hypothetical protein
VKAQAKSAHTPIIGFILVILNPTVSATFLPKTIVPNAIDAPPIIQAVFDETIPEPASKATEFATSFAPQV